MDIITAVLLVTLTGLISAVILVIAAKFMYVPENAQVGEVAAVLPGANCGACGYAGCNDYAKAIVEAGAAVNLCVPGGANAATAVASVMGVDAGAVESKKAVVVCQGTCDNAKTKFEYTGVQSCAACAALFGGSNACSFGCLGYGDCVKACTFGAIEVVNGVAHVNQAKCTGCGACATACPKNVITVQTESPKPVVLCHNTEKGGVTRKECTAGCIGCMKCVKTCPQQAIAVENNLAFIDHEKCIDCGACIEVCPVHAIQEIG